MTALLDRVMAKVDKAPEAAVNAASCWLWTGHRDRDGYGEIQVGDRWCRVHRITYEEIVGPIAPGLQIDHLCRVRNCVNPAHLEPVTPRENSLRGESFAAKNAAKEECHAGHPFDVANTYIYRGRRCCRTCGRERARRYASRKREVSS